MAALLGSQSSLTYDASVLSHIEIYVSDLDRSAAFWGWLLECLGYAPYQAWPAGRSWRLGTSYLAFVQAPADTRSAGYHRRRVGLNHLAFHATSAEQVDELTESLRGRGTRVLYEDRHPHAGGPGRYAVFFEDPDGIKVELVLDAEATPRATPRRGTGSARR